MCSMPKIRRVLPMIGSGRGSTPYWLSQTRRIPLSINSPMAPPEQERIEYQSSAGLEVNRLEPDTETAFSLSECGECPADPDVPNETFAEAELSSGEGAPRSRLSETVAQDGHYHGDTDAAWTPEDALAPHRPTEESEPLVQPSQTTVATHLKSDDAPEIGSDEACQARSEAIDLEQGDVSLVPHEALLDLAGRDEPDDDQEVDDAGVQINPVEYAEQFFVEHELEVLFDDSLMQRGKPLTAHDRSMINPVLAVRPLMLPDVLDMMIIDCKEKELKLKAGEVRAALRHVVSEMKHARRNFIVAPLLKELTPAETADATREWDRFDTLFEPIPNLRPSVVIQHFIWQVLSKVLGRDVDHHLMPVITSSIQGSGKTTLVRLLLGPLKELVTGASLLSDFGDRRTLGLFRYLVAVLDDLEAVTEKQVPVLKSIITGQDVHRRLLGSSMDAKVRQMSTAIGTSNSRIEELVPDDTGHRRFATLLFRNGAVAKGGDPAIWQTASSLNYEIMWRSVNPFDPSPLAGHLVALTQYQSMAAAPTALAQFLIALDPDDPDVRGIAYRNQGVQAQGLHDLYEARSGKQLTKQAFAKQMHTAMQNPMVPFGDKHRFGDMRVYRYRRADGVFGVADRQNTQ